MSLQSVVRGRLRGCRFFFFDDINPLVASPEVQPSGMRDYSLYVLDPLEDIMSRTARGSSDGVAVGMGLLSSILSAQGDTAATVTGTVIQCTSDEVALEVVISLRQVSVSSTVAQILYGLTTI